MWQKLSASVGSATPDPLKGEASAQPVPPPSVANKPAPGQTGPKGLAPRTTYTRVNTGVPPTPDAGGSNQKSQTPRGMEFLPAKVAQENTSMTTAMKRPILHDLIKEAMAGTIEKVDISAEAAHQAGIPQQEKVAAAPTPSVPTDYIEKLAGALTYSANLLKEAEIGTPKIEPGKGPGALEVLEAPGGENPFHPGNQGKATDKNCPPTNPPVQTSGVQSSDPANAMADNADMMHGEQPVEPIKNEKTSAILQKNLALFGINKEATLLDKNLAIFGLKKQAEDALAPAKVAAGSAEATGSDPPVAASPSEEKVPSEPSDVTSQKTMISSNDSAINYKKVQAKKDPKSDMADVVTEPALSASSDKTLNLAFSKTQEAGAKIASDLTRTSAAEALLRKLAADKESRDKKEKEKDSMGSPTMPATPAAATGLRSDQVGM